MADLSEVRDLIVEQGEGFAKFKQKYDERFDRLESELSEVAKKNNRPAVFSAERAQPKTQWIDVKRKEPVPVLAHGEPACTDSTLNLKQYAVGRVLRGLACGSAADDAKELADERKAMGIGTDPGGGYSVQGELANWWVDLLRNQMVLSQAGAQTIPMNSNSLSIARLTGDPTVSWHGENGALSASDATLGQVNLKSKTCTAMVKVSLELAQDSANIDSILQSALTNALAGAIDSAGLQGVSVNAGAAPSGVLSFAGRNNVTSVGTPTDYDKFIDGMYELMADNVKLGDVGALIAHPKLWKQLRKLKTGLSSDKTSLVAPAEIAALPKLWTNACPEGTAVIADWRDLLFGVRKQISVQVLREAFMGSNLQLAFLAYARLDFVPLREASFCTLEGITYS